MLEDHIVSFTEGRIRIRHDALRDATLGQEVCTFLQDMNGIESVEYKAITGSLLIRYDDENISQEEISVLLEQGQEWLNENAPSMSASAQATETQTKSCCGILPNMSCSLTSAQKRKLYNRTMLSTFLVTLLSGGVGNKKAHYLAGGAFAALTLAHIWRMRKVI